MRNIMKQIFKIYNNGHNDMTIIFNNIYILFYNS